MIIKAKYNSETGKITGFYPEDIDYKNNVLNTDNKIIDGEPYIEISEEQHQAALSKQMCVEDGIFQEYIESDDILILNAKAAKKAEIKSVRNTYLYKEIISNGNFYKATRDAKLLFFSKINQMTDIQYPLDWRLSDDITWVQLTKDEAYELYNLFEEQEKSGYQHESELLTALNVATAINEVSAIIWKLT